MKNVFKCLFLGYMIFKLVLTNSVSYASITIILMLMISNIVREKYLDSIWIVLIEFIIITYSIRINPVFAILYGITAYEVVYRKIYYGILPVILPILFFMKLEEVPDIFAVIGICGLLAFVNRQYTEKSGYLRESYDIERRYRYELEQTKLRLLNSSREVAHIAEIKERNRIAREIHDNVGHSIAGILMQLQASNKLYDRDTKRSKDLLEKSIEGLSESLTILRNAVHNLKPREDLGIDYIQNIIDNFNFCPVDFNYSGNFNSLTAEHVEIITTNIKEALTNASKHSKATRIYINIDINDNFVRVYIKDNGIGCTNIKENLGISGMRERIRNMGGSLSISGENGFLIVGILPIRKLEGGGIFENIDS